jgi:hypothetical protein
MLTISDGLPDCFFLLYVRVTSGSLNCPASGYAPRRPPRATGRAGGAPGAGAGAAPHDQHNKKQVYLPLLFTETNLATRVYVTNLKKWSSSEFKSVRRRRATVKAFRKKRIFYFVLGSDEINRDRVSYLLDYSHVSIWECGYAVIELWIAGLSQS